VKRASLQSELKQRESVKAELQFDRERLKWADEKRKLQGQLKEAIKLNDELEARVGVAEVLSSRARSKPFKIGRCKGKSPATPLLNLSDWHVEEPVRPETVLGHNEYNLEIAKQRAEAVCQRSVLLLADGQNLAAYERIVLCLSGDFITGWLRPENEQNNLLAPLEAARYATDLLESFISTIHVQFPKIQISCFTCVGNHGRHTVKTQHANRVKTNYEQEIYHNLARVYRTNPKIDFQIGQGLYNLIQCGKHVVRQSHGDHIKSNGGVGGISIPANKAVFRANTINSVHYDIFADKHRYTPAPRFLFNGSMIGYNTYALSIPAEYEPPCQSMILADHARGVVWTKPIFCD
jgi:hypothetical protein